MMTVVGQRLIQDVVQTFAREAHSRTRSTPMSLLQPSDLHRHQSEEEALIGDVETISLRRSCARWAIRSEASLKLKTYALC
jgi:hypothetical protein